MHWCEFNDQNPMRQSPTCLLIAVLLLHLVDLTVSDTISSDVVRVTGSGPVRGRKIRSELGAVADVFLGIPYAQPPIGPLRFAPTVVPESSWDQTKDCLEYKPACPSNSSITSVQQKSYSEDCLFVNVFAGDKCSNETSCPVIMYIHGGYFEFDSPNLFQPELLVENFASNGLIMVTVAYRLGVLGYFTTPDSATGGNWAFHDLIGALGWIKREIGHFGGDPDLVTVMGHSSGAEMVQMLTLLPAANTLFHQAISLSGSSASFRSQSLYEPDYGPARSIYQKLNCSTKDSDENWDTILSCMREKTFQELVDAQRAIEDINAPFVTAMFDGPTVDGNLFPEYPEQLYAKRTPRPYMIGVTSEESGFLFATPADFKNVNNTYDLLRRKCEQAVDKWSFKRRELIIDECIKEYTSRNESDLMVGINEIYSDVDYYISTYSEARITEQSGQPAFLYQFDYEKVPGKKPHHSQDLVYVMGRQYDHPFSPNENDTRLSAYYPSLFASFARVGNPTPLYAGGFLDWQAFRVDQSNYWSVNLLPQAKLHFHDKAVKFWTEVAPNLEICGETCVATAAPSLPQSLGPDTNISVDANSSSIHPDSNVRAAPSILIWIIIVLCLIVANYFFVIFTCGLRSDLLESYEPFE